MDQNLKVTLKDDSLTGQLPGSMSTDIDGANVDIVKANQGRIFTTDCLEAVKLLTINARGFVGG